MKASRRAASRGATSAARVAVRATSLALGGALAGVMGVWAAVAVRMARKVVTPEPRVADTRIVGLDLNAQTITLQRTADTELPGRYGLFTTGSEDYVKLGTVLAADATTVRRKLLTQIGAASRLSERAAFSGWYFNAPEQLQLPFAHVDVTSPVGACPAWLFPAESPSKTWVIQIHGRGTTRAECLRAVPLLHRLGSTVLVTSYRNDGEAAATRSGLSELGASEWQDIDGAISFARRSGAEKIVLMGWSMGGAIALQTVLNSHQAGAVTGLVLDSPVVDWRSVLEFQAQQMRLPAPVTELALGALGTPWAQPMTGSAAISLDDLDVVRRAAELWHPILILHSDDDGFVPSDASHALAGERPDLVELVTFQGARHTKLWNYDQKRWTDAITSWLRRHGLVAAETTDHPHD